MGKTRIYVGLLLALPLLFGCNARRDVMAKLDDAKARIRGDVRTAPIVVKVLPAGESASEASFSYVGSVEAGTSLVITANNSGTLRDFSCRAGQSVSAGQVIANVESQSIRSAFEMAESTLQQANDGYERVRKVYESGAVAEVKMVEIETDLAKAKAAYSAASKALENCSVKAPVSGVIDEVYATAGSEVIAAAPLVRIIDMNSREIHFSVPESEISSLKVGERVSVDIPALDRTVSATVSSKGMVASSISHSYECVLDHISDMSSLMPGMVCKVRVSRPSGAAALIPASAVMTDRDGRYVWTVDSDGIVGKQYITVGGYSGNGIIVEDALPEGSRVIVEGSRKVSTGMKVETTE